MNKLTAFLLVLIALLQYRLWFGDGNLREMRRLQERIVELTEEGEKRRQRNAALEAEIVDLKEGTDAIEEHARRELGMIKEGETLVQIVDAAHPTPSPEPTPPPRKRRKPVTPAPAATEAPEHER
ncbi:cell division protein FtsB [Methylococcus sp. ANG]|uniref:cell division protein FtsB n=1 Tax=unclassified Methylococcus TaxID=2618889 RepID=UPI001C52E0B9|nr:cell division protein FtsB [Methylococcus sp. Mc7]QXP84925.1 cell division protein FtsB [Methylococcus sp. Mc7]